MRLVLDFETYYDDVYSLRKMYTLEYVRDDRFKVHGVAVKLDDQPTEWLSESDFRRFLGELPPDIELVCHNTYFDGLVLFHHYAWVPRFYRDTLSMARALFIHLKDLSLDNLCKLFNLGGKTPEVLGKTKGVRTLPADLAQRLGGYAIQDVELTARLYDKLVHGLPDEELALIDLTMRWACRPVLHLDLPRLVRAYRNALRERRAKIKASGTTLEVLSSQPKFTQYLLNLGIDIPKKLNPKGKEIPALGKNDLGFRQMMANHPEHRALFEGRMAAKSTINHTRIKRLFQIGSRGTLPMPLKYYGAHTGRWSGTDGLNPQNFTRGSELRKSILAPPGYVIVVADLKQIEARLNMWFSGEDMWLQVFAEGRDIYRATASQHFQVPYDDVTPAQRFFGKTLELGLGYGMGWRKFRVQAALKEIFLTEEEAYRAVLFYRQSHPFIAETWRDLNARLNFMYREDCDQYRDPVNFIHEKIILPNDMVLDYSGLTPTERGDWYYGEHKKIYGGAMLENIIQALARIVIGQHLLAIERTGITTVSSTHDEILAVVRKKDADEAVKVITAIMGTPPDWAPDLPLDVDIGYDRSYSK